jgi:Mn-containing catalase
MQYFVQSFAAKQPYPDKFDLLMDIATEELSHLEIVGATITMLLDGVSGELKDISDGSCLSRLMKGTAEKEALIHEKRMNPQFLVLTGGRPRLTDSNGVRWSVSYVNANGDLTVDLRSNIAAQSRAKNVYEYLLQFTDDPLVQDSLRFLMTREITHFQQFSAALMDIQPNFPPGIRQGDPRYSHLTFNMSDGTSYRGPWPEGHNWEYVDNPIEYVRQSRGLQTQEPMGTPYTEEDIQKQNKQLSQIRSKEVLSNVQKGEMQWSLYGSANQNKMK